MRRYALLAIGLALISCTGPAYGSFLGGDPTSTCGPSEVAPSDRAFARQAVSFPSRLLEEIAERATRLLTIEVIDVTPPKLNTEDGEFPTEDQLRQFGLDRLGVHMDVLVRVIETISATEPELVIDPGHELVINVGGGSFRTVLTQRQALAIGIGEEGDVEIDWGHQTSECLTEGDHIAVFLVDFSVPGYLTRDQPRIGVVHPGGVLSPWIDGLWLDPQTGEPVDLDDLQVLGKPMD